ncbi:MAG TPA: hypothetical protein P5121_40190, partial [Caldilineaceae bacterium]|nr:hypothetical protein [Caldilineaceae bacterium]
MKSPVKLRWVVWCLASVASLVLTACPVPRIPPSLIQRAAPTAIVAEESGTIPPPMTPTPTAIALPEPEPTATATPEPAAVADPAEAARLTAEGKERFLVSDLAGAEPLFIEAIAADPSYVPAYIALTDLYFYWPHYWQQALDTARKAAELAPEDPEVLAYLAWAQQGAHLFDDAWATVLQA